MNNSAIQPFLREKAGLPAMAWTLLALLILAPAEVPAFPPAPHHTFYGMVRDELGIPLSTPGTTVILETLDGRQISVAINPGIENGCNYSLDVPMDSGLIGGAYKATALNPTVPFRIKVQVGDTVYLPIEMQGNLSNIGQPAQKTRLDLTLGQDTNGDGLPDAWQRLFNTDLSKVGPGSVGKNGLTYLQMYIAGTYVYDPTNGFSLDIVSVTNGTAVLEFLSVSGHTYTIVGSSDLKSWSAVSFRVPAEDAVGTVRTSFTGDSVAKIQVEVPPPSDGAAPTFFRLMTQ